MAASHPTPEGVGFPGGISVNSTPSIERKASESAAALHGENANGFPSISVTEAGSSILRSFGQLRKTPYSRLTTESGIVTCSSFS